MRGLTTHISAPNSNTDWKTALKYVRLSKYIKNCGEFPKKLVDSSAFGAAIELSENNVSSNHMNKDMARYFLKDIFQPLISRLCK